MESVSATQARRVLLANEPRLFREMLQRVIQNTPGMEVVGEITDMRAVRSMLAQTGAHVLIVSLTPEGCLPETIDELLIEFPSLCVLGVADDGSGAELRWAEIHQQSLQNLSLSQLIGLLAIQSSLQLTPPYLVGAGAQINLRN